MAVGSYITGVGLAMCTTLMSALGLSLQKLTHRRIDEIRKKSKGRKLSRRDKLHLQPFRHRLWIVGISLMLASSLLSLAVFALVGQAVASCFAAVTLIWNAIFGSLILKERLVVLDYIVTSMLLIGAIVTIVFGGQRNPDDRQAFLDANAIHDLFATTKVYVFSAIVGLVVFSAMYWIFTVDNRRKNDKFVPMWCFASTAWWRAFLAGIFSATTGICSKGFTSIISAVGKSGNGAENFGGAAFWLFLICLPISLILQISYLNSGLRYFDATLVVPIYQSLIVIFGVVFGFIYWDEGSQLGKNMVGFLFGICLIVSALFLLLLKPRGRPLEAIADVIVELFDIRGRAGALRHTVSDEEAFAAYGYYPSEMRGVDPILKSHGRVVERIPLLGGESKGQETPSGHSDGEQVPLLSEEQRHAESDETMQVMRLRLEKDDTGADVITYAELRPCQVRRGAHARIHKPNAPLLPGTPVLPVAREASESRASAVGAEERVELLQQQGLVDTSETFARTPVKEGKNLSEGGEDQGSTEARDGQIPMRSFSQPSMAHAVDKSNSSSGSGTRAHASRTSFSPYHGTNPPHSCSSSSRTAGIVLFDAGSSESRRHHRTLSVPHRASGSGADHSHTGGLRSPTGQATGESGFTAVPVGGSHGTEEEAHVLGFHASRMHQGGVLAAGASRQAVNHTAKGSFSAASTMNTNKNSSGISSSGYNAKLEEEGEMGDEEQQQQGLLEKETLNPARVWSWVVTDTPKGFYKHLKRAIRPPAPTRPSGPAGAAGFIQKDRYDATDLQEGLDQREIELVSIKNSKEARDRAATEVGPDGALEEQKDKEVEPGLKRQRRSLTVDRVLNTSRRSVAMARSRVRDMRAKGKKKLNKKVQLLEQGETSKQRKARKKREREDELKSSASEESNPAIIVDLYLPVQPAALTELIKDIPYRRLMLSLRGGLCVGKPKPLTERIINYVESHPPSSATAYYSYYSNQYFYESQLAAARQPTDIAVSLGSTKGSAAGGFPVRSAGINSVSTVNTGALDRTGSDVSEEDRYHHKDHGSLFSISDIIAVETDLDVPPAATDHTDRNGEQSEGEMTPLSPSATKTQPRRRVGLFSPLRSVTSTSGIGFVSPPLSSNVSGHSARAGVPDTQHHAASIAQAGGSSPGLAKDQLDGKGDFSDVLHLTSFKDYKTSLMAPSTRGAPSATGHLARRARHGALGGLGYSWRAALQGSFLSPTQGTSSGHTRSQSAGRGHQKAGSDPAGKERYAVGGRPAPNRTSPPRGRTAGGKAAGGESAETNIPTVSSAAGAFVVPTVATSGETSEPSAEHIPAPSTVPSKLPSWQHSSGIVPDTSVDKSSGARGAAGGGDGRSELERGGVFSVNNSLVVGPEAVDTVARPPAAHLADPKAAAQSHLNLPMQQELEEPKAPEAGLADTLSGHEEIVVPVVEDTMGLSAGVLPSGFSLPVAVGAAIAIDPKIVLAALMAPWVRVYECPVLSSESIDAPVWNNEDTVTSTRSG